MSARPTVSVGEHLREAPTPCVDPGATAADFAALLAVGDRFPSPQLVADALRMMPRVLARGVLQGAPDGRDFFLSCGPGAVGVRITDSDKVERSAERRRRAELDLARFAPVQLGHVMVEQDGWLPGARYLEVLPLLDDDGSPARPVEQVSERAVKSWSRKSRANMTRALAEIDYAPLFASGRLPAMLTTTYPGAWQDLAPSGKTSKAHLRMLWKRWHRAWGHRPPALWKMEFQGRGAPHYHLFAVPEVGEAPCSCCGARLGFWLWFSHTWADIIGARADRDANGYAWDLGYQVKRGDSWVRQTEREASIAAGTGIDYRQGARMIDPKRLAVYFTKHSGAAGGKEYQHEVPREWQAPGQGPGRFWGMVGLERVRQEVAVSVPDYVQLRRTLRRLGRVQVSYGASGSRWPTNVAPRVRERRVMRVSKVNEFTGEARVQYRTVTRPVGPLGHGGLAGGWLCVNDGPAVVAALARWLDPPEERARYLP